MSSRLVFMYFLWALVLFGFYSANADAVTLPGDEYPYSSFWKNGYATTCGTTSTGCSAPAARDAAHTFLFGAEHSSSAVGHWIVIGENASTIEYRATYTHTNGYEYIHAISVYANGAYVPPPPPNPCPDKQGQQAIPTGQVGYGESAAGTNPTQASMCDADHCIMTVNNATAIPIGGGKQANYVASATYTGAQNTNATACPITVFAPTPKDPTLPNPIDTVTPDGTNAGGVPQSQSDCPAGSAFGQVNGTNICAPGGTTQTAPPSSSTQNNNGTTTDSNSTTTKTVNDDGTITTTTTTGSTSGGATSTTTTSSTSGGSNGLNGSNGTDGKDGKDFDGFDLGVAPAAEGGAAPTIDGITPGAGADGQGGATKTFSVGSHFSGGASGCIADRSIEVLGQTFTIPLSALCEWMGIVYKVISIMAIFAAFRILVM